MAFVLFLTIYKTFILIPIIPTALSIRIFFHFSELLHSESILYRYSRLLVLHLN